MSVPSPEKLITRILGLGVIAGETCAFLSLSRSYKLLIYPSFEHEPLFSDIGIGVGNDMFICCQNASEASWLCTIL